MFAFIPSIQAQVKKTKLNQVPNSLTTPVNGTWNELIPGSLCGAELNYKSAGEREIEIYLTKYFYCSDFKIDSEETVTVQESLINMVTSKTRLGLVSVKDTSRLVNVNCPGYKNGCYKKVIYSGKVNIMSPMMGGYDVTWGYCCWDEHHMSNIQGVQEFQKQGLSLTLHIPELTPGQINSSPVFLFPPVFSTCKGQLIAIPMAAIDNDRDSLGYELSALSNYKTADGAKFFEEPTVYPGQPMNKSFAGGRPPFQKVLYKKGYDYRHPMGGKQIELHARTGEMQMKPDSIGEFLIGVSVKEYRNRKLLGSHQRVFKMHVVD